MVVGGMSREMAGRGAGLVRRRAERWSRAQLAVAAAATSHAPCAVAPGQGFEAGQAVTVMPTDYGRDPVAGTLMGLDAHEIVLRRHDERAGTVHVHFPRAGFQIKPQVLEKAA